VDVADILIALLKELFGVDGGAEKPPARPPRPPRPAAPASERGRVEAEILREFFGGEPEAPEASRPPPSPRKRKEPRPARRSSAVRDPVPAIPAARAPAIPPAAFGLAGGSLPAGAGAETALPAPPGAVRGGGPPDFVAQLRGDAGAARRALVLAEIFGRPLAERKGGVPE
jgi:hypothetical protein